MESISDPSPFRNPEPSVGLAQQEPEALDHLKTAIQAGTPWHQALLEAVGLWTQPERSTRAGPTNT